MTHSFHSDKAKRPKPTIYNFHSDEAKRQKADDSRLILSVNPDKAHKVSIIVYNALYMINSR